MTLKKSSAAAGRTPRPRKSIERKLLPQDLHGLIATRAYELYQQRINSGALDDWLLAEREILGNKIIGDENRPHRGGYAAEEQE